VGGAALRGRAIAAPDPPMALDRACRSSPRASSSKDSQQHKPGVSIKQLLKDASKAKHGCAPRRLLARHLPVRLPAGLPATGARPPAPPCSAGADHHGSSPLFLTTLRGHTDAVGGLAFSADGTALATACEDRSVRVFALADLATGKQLAFRSKALRRGPVDVAFVDDAEHVAVMTKGAPHLGTQAPECLGA
jgi:WD40 repeat protein